MFQLSGRQMWSGRVTSPVNRDVLSSSGPGQAGKRVFRVELTRGPITRATNFVSTQGPSERWYVESADLEPVKDLCRNMPTG